MVRGVRGLGQRAVLLTTITVLVGGVLAAVASAQAADWEITPDGLGPLRIGTTIEDVRDALPESYSLGEEVPLAPDLIGRVVSLDGAVQALLPTEGDGDGAVVTTIIVLGEDFRTADGIGPGTTIEDAERAYGAVTLAYDPGDQGRERVLFDDGPDGLSFRASESVGPQAGAYRDDETITDEYETGARLTSVWIGALDPPAPEPSATETPAEQEAESESATESEAVEEGDHAESTSGGDTALPDTGFESVVIAVGAIAVLFLGFALTRTSNRLMPWS